MISVPLVMGCYLFANIAYYAVLPLSSIVNFETGEVSLWSTRPVVYHSSKPIEGFATIFAKTSMGTAGQVILPLLVALSAAGAANGSIFAGMASDSRLEAFQTW
jgi:hypothetical protein